MTPTTPREFRDTLLTMIRADLLGPAGGPDEELDKQEDHVYKRYLVGMLAPRSQELNRAELDQLATVAGDDAEDGSPDVAVPGGSSLFPSSMGLSFMVGMETTTLFVDAEWGWYQRIRSDRQLRVKGDDFALVWKRTPIEVKELPVVLQKGVLSPRPLHSDHPLVVLHGRIREVATGWMVTLFMVNEQQERTARNEPKDEVWVFQPRIRVRDASGRPVFIQRAQSALDHSRLDAVAREEAETLDMLYRHRREFAVGHGVSVHATRDAHDASRATMVETEWIPAHEVAQQTARSEKDDPNLAGLVLDMKLLAEMPVHELLPSLERIGSAYDAWIHGEEARLAIPGSDLAEHAEAARRAIDQCRRTCERITAGVQLLRDDPIALKAFRFANRAMWQQRVHSIFARAVRKKEVADGCDAGEFDVPENRSWRLFQLAFILLNLPSITALDHPDRGQEHEAIADLLWFATGGGKTEAYLGLTAYTLALRRLQGGIGGRDGAHGVAVLMRYTLRLLTLQQFQRAAALICACELIRREDPAQWGTVPFRLGLWVGNKTTPNRLADASESIKTGINGGMPSINGTPLQFTSCPWCGCQIKSHNIRVYLPPSDVGRCVTYCGDTVGQCAFSERRAPREGLPVLVVDKDIYRHPPSMLIATVDKFAQLPWKGETQMLFGRVDGECPRHGFLSPDIDDKTKHLAKNGLPACEPRPHEPLRPPDLIIQDELHLISGPLGSMVGLYEAAVDELCSWEVDGRKVRPKLIASTATVRRASDQVRKLFVRTLEVFPPQGTTIGDSFFAIERPVSVEYPGRLYMGFAAIGRRYPAAIIRSYVAHLAAAQWLYENYGTMVDPWMTLVGYFNSIRELAGTRRLLEDDIKARLRDTDQRGLAKRRLYAIEELTSRKSGTDIPSILDRMETVFDPVQAQRAAQLKATRKSSIPRPYDVILATNMISVGVDIERLGLMMIAGQPKTTAEYIQASSRVGRSKGGPGLVCTVFNWARPRDLSHYESFEHYHDTFYKHVESLSVTPYSEGALARGLPGVLVALMRLWDSHLNDNRGAGKVRDDDPLWEQVRDILSMRGVQATDDQLTATTIGKKLAFLRDEWLQRMHNQKDHHLAYKADGGATVALLANPEDGEHEPFVCLNSLRDVEPTVELVLDTNTAGLNR